MKNNQKTVVCRNCSAQIPANSKICPNCKAKNKKPLYKQAWFIVLSVLFVIGIAGSAQNNSPDENNSNTQPVDVIDFASMDQSEIKNWADTNKIEISVESEYSDTIQSGAFIGQSIEAGKSIREGDSITISYSLGKEPSTEYKNALAKAESYSSMMFMSRKAIYDQLTSQYGEQFPKDAAQYAIDTIIADWNENALAKATSYAENMSMSQKAIYDQLISDYGEQFTKSEAQYAIDHLEVDWNANALAKAKTYQDSMNMSKKAVYEQLISQYGEQFTAEQAQYAIDHLDN